MENFKTKTIILIPHFNNLDGLTKSISCIHHRTGIDVLVIDDGSHDDYKPTDSNLSSFINENVNLNIISLKENKGITLALNHGLNYILEKGCHCYIARLDCGDTTVVNRFHIQEDFLDKNKDCALVGSWVKWMSNETNKEIYSFRPPASYKKIKKKMSIRCNVIHPSAMYRVSIVEKVGLYPINYKAAEDYAYFFEIMKKGKVANIPKYLTRVEHNSGGITNKNKRVQSRSKLKVIMKYGRKDFYLLYGIAFNVALISTPARIVLKIKSKLR